MELLGATWRPEKAEEQPEEINERPKVAEGGGRSRLKEAEGGWRSN